MQDIADILKHKDLKGDHRNKHEFQAYGNNWLEEFGKIILCQAWHARSILSLYLQGVRLPLDGPRAVTASRTSFKRFGRYL